MWMQCIGKRWNNWCVKLITYTDIFIIVTKFLIDHTFNALGCAQHFQRNSQRMINHGDDRLLLLVKNKGCVLPTMQEFLKEICCEVVKLEIVKNEYYCLEKCPNKELLSGKRVLNLYNTIQLMRNEVYITPFPCDNAATGFGTWRKGRSSTIRQNSIKTTTECSTRSDCEQTRKEEEK
ncbi:hypothetical protein CEXT_423421 [Caerostris extrusa]|uniref:Uncharacterized protein n=1 Tax=Caerostris extrusa TaxID=172846 RepID=A0AAV4V6J2_CAEEX|nr:hypothetical protein CEXT_423421 [Caerostris extrusa]